MSDEQTAEALARLIVRIRSEETQFRRSAACARDEGLRQLFIDRADELAEEAIELGSLIRQLGGSLVPAATDLVPNEETLVSNLSPASDDAGALLAACAASESAAVRDYQTVLEAQLPDFVRRALRRQLEAASANLEQLRALRDQHLRPRPAGRPLGPDAGRG